MTFLTKSAPARRKVATAILPIMLAFAPQTAAAQDMDCEIMFCLAAGFGQSECMPAYREMIDNVTPWPIKPPFGICTLSNADGTPAGPMDTSTPNMEYLAKTRVLWWEYRKDRDDEDGTEHHWKLSSCLTDNQTCTILSQGGSSSIGPRLPVRSHNGNELRPPRIANRHRAFAIEYVDYEGAAYQTEWTSY